MAFSAFIKDIRVNQKSWSLAEASRRIGISGTYLLQLEAGTRNPPKPAILKRMAEAYGLSEKKLLEAAGYLQPEETDEGKIRQAFLHAVSDPDFKYGTRLDKEPSVEVMRFIVELYEKLRNRKLLN